MHPPSVDVGDTRLQLWRRVREYAVPPAMIETATARRAVGDWAGACAAARVDAALDLRAVARTRGRDLAARIRDDLRHLAPDLLRWHLPRVAPDGLLRPGLTVELARYPAAAGALRLVARTAPAWADGGQRIGLVLWDGSRDGCGLHPHPRPDRRFRLDLHRHLWDARRAGELRERSGAPEWPGRAPPVGDDVPAGCAVHRWPAEAALLRRASGRPDAVVVVRAGARVRLALDGDATVPRVASGPTRSQLLLPDAATWVPPDLQLLRAGLIEPDRLHPLVAAALVPDRPPAAAPGRPAGAGPPWLVRCQGAQHRVGLVAGVLTPLDHDPDELRRERLLTALGGTPLPCLRSVGEATRNPDSLADVRARLDHGDITGALAALEDLLGPDAALPAGALRAELESAADRRLRHGLYRAGLAGRGPLKTLPDARRRTGERLARRAASR
jgi:hypothetical protein